VTLLQAGRATIEIADVRQAEFIDRVEVGRRVAGPVRLAFEVENSAALGQRLADAGATVVAGPIVTPWRD
jgi:lactoylglutathione lyase